MKAAVGSLCTLVRSRRRLFDSVFEAWTAIITRTFHTRVLRATDEIVEGEEGKRQLISSFSAAAAAPALSVAGRSVRTQTDRAQREREREERAVRACGGGRNAHCSESSFAR